MTDDFELAEHELTLLQQAAETVDTIDRLQAALDEGPVIVDGSQGPKAHPALPELRQQRIVFSRLIAQLGVPVGGDEDDDGRVVSQRRSARGSYRPRTT